MEAWLSGGGIVVIFFVGFFFLTSIRVLNEYERGVIFRLGRALPAPKGPGLIILIPIFDKMVKIDMRTLTLDVPSQDIITRDNVTIKVNAVVYFKVVDPLKSVIAVENYLYAASQLSQTTLRSVIGQVVLDGLLAERDTINHKLQGILDQQTELWGIKVANVEVKQIDLPPEMQRAMARQAEAERDRRAKVIAAEAEFQAAKQLSEAADQMNKSPQTILLRYLQTLKEVSTNQASTIVFPFPTEFIKVFSDSLKKNT